MTVDSSKTIGVLGFGSIGRRHALNSINLGYDVIVYDPNPNISDISSLDNIKIHSERSSVFKETDKVIIASPNENHYTDIIDGIKNDCHLFIEKPLAHKTGELDKYFEMSVEKQLTIFPALNLRYRPIVNYIKKILSEGQLKEILCARLLSSSYLPHWRKKDYRTGYAADSKTGGVIFDLIHEFDLSNYFFGNAHVAAASAVQTGVIDIAAEDCADIILKHSDTLQVSIHIDYISRPNRRQIEIQGTNGFLFADLLSNELILKNNDGEIMERKNWGSATIDEYSKELEEFILCTKGRSTPRCNLKDALSVLEQVIQSRSIANLPA